MSHSKPQLPEEPHDALPPRVQDELRELFDQTVPVPPELDEKILHAARRQLWRRYQARRVWRWSATVAAAAACMTLLVWLGHPSDPAALPGAGTQIVAVPEDIDGDGRVDIKDALALAWAIKRDTVATMQWDINGDGIVNHKDVDAVAQTAVSLDREIFQ